MAVMLDAILIEVSPAEMRAAGVDEDGRLAHFAVARWHAPSHVDALVLGRVTKVDSRFGAFVDIGLGGLGGLGEPGLLARAQGLAEGARVLVGVTRDAATGREAALAKGPGLTRAPSLPGRYVTWQPSRPGLALARALGQGRVAAELRAALDGALAEGEGALFRAAAGATEGEAADAGPGDTRPADAHPNTAPGDARPVDPDIIRAEIARLRAAWQRIEAEAATASPPALLWPAPDPVDRVLRDWPAARAVVVDDRGLFHRLGGFLPEAMPDRAAALAYYDGRTPLFEDAGIADEVEDLSARVVQVPGGPRLVFDRTEALTAIDVDVSGAGRRSKSDRAALQANLAAVPEIARQIRLRNIAGLIVVDAVSLQGKEGRGRLVQAFRHAFRDDEVTTDVLGITVAGLVEITRRRTGPPLDEWLLSRPAPAAHPEADAADALRRALRAMGGGRPVLRARRAVLAALEGPMAAALAETNRRLGQPLELVADEAATRPHVAMERPSRG